MSVQNKFFVCDGAVGFVQIFCQCITSSNHCLLLLIHIVPQVQGIGVTEIGVTEVEVYVPDLIVLFP